MRPPHVHLAGASRLLWFLELHTARSNPRVTSELNRLFEKAADPGLTSLLSSSGVEYHRMPLPENRARRASHHRVCPPTCQKSL